MSQSQTINAANQERRVQSLLQQEGQQQSNEMLRLHSIRMKIWKKRDACNYKVATKTDKI